MRAVSSAAALLAAIVLTLPAAAHGTPVDTALSWTLDPLLIATLGLTLLAYTVGAGHLAHRIGRGQRALRRRTLFFALGWISAAGATLSPLHAAGERSFTFHMIEHEILMLISAPMLVLARPMPAMFWAFPRVARRAIGLGARRAGLVAAGRVLTHAVTATLLQAAALWLWHLPGLFGLALVDDGWHLAQHVSFFVAALAFWQAMLRRGHAARAVICLFVTTVITGALGALMSLSISPWYERYAALGLTSGGLTAVQDQQIAGLLMWVPGGAVHAGAALALLSRILVSKSS